MEYIVYRCSSCNGEYIVITAHMKRLGVIWKRLGCPYCGERWKHLVGEYDDFKECMKNRVDR